MNRYEIEYHILLKDVLERGSLKDNRTGTPAYTVFSRSLKVNLQEGFPFLTGRKMFFKNVVTELLWFINGETDLERFHRNGVKIWDAWADEKGQLGKVYGYQLTNFNSSGHNQLEAIIKSLREDPSSRRHLVSLWNPLELGEMSLPPCHYAFQFVPIGEQLNLQVTMRSVDIFIGLPYDIALYSLLLIIVSRLLSFTPAEVIITGADVHVYKNHKEAVGEYLSKSTFNLPRVGLSNFSKLEDLRELDFNLINYKSNKHIRAEIAV